MGLIRTPQGIDIQVEEDELPADAGGSFEGGTVPDATTFESGATFEDGINVTAGETRVGLFNVGEGGTTFSADQATGQVGFYGAQVSQQGPINDVAGGATVDAEARTAINALLAALRSYGLLLDV